ncbi:MAG: hypothetical protein CMI54_01665 [Parcubacteria group bacterium]|nr:hypothetical protein [Parcubacteria group bacterium]|tara:strand:+ start:21498 stop:21734 length:237 start_codon:yes stop_codon:yes gene_type:complete
MHIIEIEYQNEVVEAHVEYSFYEGFSGFVSGAHEDCFEGSEDEYDIELLELKENGVWVDKSELIPELESEIIGAIHEI